MEKIFKLEDEIYNKNILEKAILDFSEVSEIFLQENELKILWENESEINEIFNEFMNYCIWLFNQ